jgi:DNA-binding NarL/FixJ family response regulator
MREALANMVADRWPGVVVREAADFPAAWSLAAQGPDLCLLDLAMPGADPRAGVDALLAAAPDLRVLVITGSHDDALLIDLLARGVAGFAPKQSSKGVLLAAIELVLAGGRYLPPRLAELLAPSPRPEPQPVSGMSPRQMEVVRLLAQGFTNKDIARTLAVSPATIKTHVAQILAATGAANRTEASMRAKALGLLDVAPPPLAPS